MNEFRLSGLNRTAARMTAVWVRFQVLLKLYSLCVYFHSLHSLSHRLTVKTCCMCVRCHFGLWNVLYDFGIPLYVHVHTFEHRINILVCDAFFKLIPKF